MDAPDERVTPPASTYWLTRFVFLRLLGVVYFCAFLSAALQLQPLIGARGILPAQLFLAREAMSGAGFFDLPTIFWFHCTDRFLVGTAWLGVVLSTALALGLADSILLALLWFLYMSFIHVGQLFWGYGWEILLLEAGFLAIFFAPILSLHPFPKNSPPPTAVVWLLRWLLFRVMFGAGLIKLRGDPCWRELTCLVYHYETQPRPNPLSWLLHQAPPWFHKVGVLWNHFVELIVPFGLFAPRRIAAIAGALQIAFQLTLIVSGNLSWLNWLTLTIAIACFDDRALQRIVPKKMRAWIEELATQPPSRMAVAGRYTSYLLVAVVICLSIAPTVNLLSHSQVMNGSFDRLHLVNTYGAFGSVGRERDEIVIEGTRDATVDENTRWQEYEFPCKPGDPMRRPCVISPYHYRLDWQLWFAAMSTYQEEPWLVRYIDQLLRGEPGALRLVEKNPFPDAPPRYIRATLYRYRFTKFGERGWWKRERIGEWLPAVSLADPSLPEFLRDTGMDEP
jgi:hypothetical protein